MHEDWIYHQQSWDRVLEDGSVERGFRILRTANPSPVVVVPEWAPPEVRDELLSFGAEGAEDETRVVTIMLRNFPDWDVPLRPAIPLSVDDGLALEAERETHIAARTALFEWMAAELIDVLEATGSEVLAQSWQGGYVSSRIGPATLLELVERDDILRITDQTFAVAQPQSWGLGESKNASKLGADIYHSLGYTGERGNASRHNFGDITVAVVDNELEDEGCFLYDGCSHLGCTTYTGCSGASRIQERLNCDVIASDGRLCSTTSNFTGALDDSAASLHGTQVASIILGDYADKQGRGKALGDTGWTSGDHSTAWEYNHSGLAPEARLIMFGQSTDPAGWWAAAFDKSADRAVDILNHSNGHWIAGVSCNPVVSVDYEIAAENAFDDGVFLVASAGNSDSFVDAYGCSTVTPADTLKVFSVSGLGTGAAPCTTSTNQCLWDDDFSEGGMRVKLPSGVLTPTPAITSNDLVAPAAVTDVTLPNGTYGEATGGFTGTSSAAAFVSGAAAIVKDQVLAGGSTWYNYPGRLHTLMLAMGDRYYEPYGPGGGVAQLANGGRRDWGFGKLRLRLFDSAGNLGPYGAWFYEWSFTTASGNFAATLASTPFPSGTKFLKCVMFQVEDMSGKDMISDLNLQLQTYNSSGGVCGSTGTGMKYLSDNSYDVKAMVAEVDPGDLGYRCARVTMVKSAVTAAGVTGQVFCYAAQKYDDEN